MDGIAWAGSAMVAARTRLEIAAENLANASSDGFVRVLARGRLTATGVAVGREWDPQHGALRRTGRDYDFAIAGDGAFAVRDRAGHVAYTRNGSFVRERNGTLSDVMGRTVLGAAGALRVPNGARVDERGRVMAAGSCVDRIVLPHGARVYSGYLETSGANAISEMIDVMGAQRFFETAQKVVTAIDRTREKSSDTARVR